MLDGRSVGSFNIMSFGISEILFCFGFFNRMGVEEIYKQKQKT